MVISITIRALQARGTEKIPAERNVASAENVKIWKLARPNSHCRDLRTNTGDEDSSGQESTVHLHPIDKGHSFEDSDVHIWSEKKDGLKGGGKEAVLK